MATVSKVILPFDRPIKNAHRSAIGLAFGSAKGPSPGFEHSLLALFGVESVGGSYGEPFCAHARVYTAKVRGAQDPWDSIAGDCRARDGWVRLLTGKIIRLAGPQSVRSVSRVRSSVVSGGCLGGLD
jgi:hypothetical protein